MFGDFILLAVDGLFVATPVVGIEKLKQDPPRLAKHGFVRGTINSQRLASGLCACDISPDTETEHPVDFPLTQPLHDLRAFRIGFRHREDLIHVPSLHNPDQDGTGLTAEGSLQAYGRPLGSSLAKQFREMGDQGIGSLGPAHHQVGFNQLPLTLRILFTLDHLDELFGRQVLRLGKGFWPIRR